MTREEFLQLVKTYAITNGGGGRTNYQFTSYKGLSVRLMMLAVLGQKFDYKINYISKGKAVRVEDSAYRTFVLFKKHYKSKLVAIGNLNSPTYLLYEPDKDIAKLSKAFLQSLSNWNTVIIDKEDWEAIGEMSV